LEESGWFSRSSSGAAPSRTRRQFVSCVTGSASSSTDPPTQPAATTGDAQPRLTLPPVLSVCLLHTRTRPSRQPMRRRCGAAWPVPRGSGEHLAAEIGYGDAYCQVQMPQINLAAHPSPTRVLAPTLHPQVGSWEVFLGPSRRRPPCLMWVAADRREREVWGSGG
jgi:hypothetical protein